MDLPSKITKAGSFEGCRPWIETQQVCSPCCHLTTDTEVSAAIPPDYTAASLPRLWVSSTHPQHSTVKKKEKKKAVLYKVQELPLAFHGDKLILNLE